MTDKTAESGTGAKTLELSGAEKVCELLMKESDVKGALEFLEADNDNTTEQQIAITAIPAPTFDESDRGKDYKKRLAELGIQNIEVDEVGNVFGVRPGTGGGPRLAVCAHLDTVFPEGTNVEAVRKDGIVYAPGISDDGRGLATVLTLIRALDHAGIETEGDILFGATVGEEGLGDLGGVKNLFKTRDDIDGFISIEPGDPARLVYKGTGSQRYSVTYKGPGGHSFMDFGKPSAAHALGRAIAMISDVETPEEPKTTFNIGVINGGTSVNTIAQEAKMLVDMRSNSQEELHKLEEQILGLIRKAAEDENKRWDTDSIKVEMELVGERPAGSQSSDAAIVETSVAALRATGFEPHLEELKVSGSTDSNVPIRLGIPAVTLSGGGKSGGIHTLEEFFDPKDAFLGPQSILLTILGLVGKKGLNEPLLEKQKTEK